MATPTSATSSPVRELLTVRTCPIWLDPFEADICIEDATRRFHLKFEKVRMDGQTLDELRGEQRMSDCWLRKYFLEGILFDNQLLEFDDWIRKVYATDE